MAQIKVENNFIWILLTSIRIYSTNFIKFCSYMMFPVLGQILGILLIFCLAGLYSLYLPELSEKYLIFQDFSTSILCIVAITIPGLLVFMKAFWDYLVAYGAINSITEGYLNTGRIYDFPAHKATITSHAAKYIGLWLVYSLFWIVASFPLFWVMGGIFFIYFILIFQVFYYEPDVGVLDCFSRSLKLIRGNAFRTLLIMVIIALFTHFLFVEGVSVVFDFTKLTKVLSELFEQTLVGYIPIDRINDTMLNINSSFNLITPSKVANFFVYQIVAFIVIGFTLPLRSITWALWYKALREKEESKNKRKPGNSKKKIVKKLNPEIIERANRKFED